MKTLTVLSFAALLAAALPAAAQQTAQPAKPKAPPPPIEILADNLTVDQDGKIATFTGNVDATQGDMNLKSALLRVFYNRTSAPAENGNNAAQGAAGGGGTNQSVRRIEAEGDVLLTQKGQEAQGDTGTFDVPTNIVTLNGNVVLTQDGNVVRGQSATLDRNTGIAKVFAGDGKEKNQRVRALFVQDNQTKAQ